MKIDSKGHTTTISDTGDLNSLVENLTSVFHKYGATNVIIDLSAFGDLSPKELNQFLPLAKVQKKAKKSFVICAETDYDKVSDKLVVVPTLQEAHNMIEMDEIERDLGF